MMHIKSLSSLLLWLWKLKRTNSAKNWSWGEESVLNTFYPLQAVKWHREGPMGRKDSSLSVKLALKVTPSPDGWRTCAGPERGKAPRRPFLLCPFSTRKERVGYPASKSWTHTSCSGSLSLRPGRAVWEPWGQFPHRRWTQAAGQGRYANNSVSKEAGCHSSDREERQGCAQPDNSQLRWHK